MATINVLDTLVQDETSGNFDDDIAFGSLAASFRNYLASLMPALTGGEAAEESVISITLAAGENIGSLYWTNDTGGLLNGAPALDQYDNPITTFDGEPLFLWNTSDPRIAIAKTADGDVIAAFYIDQTSTTTADIQMVTFEPLAHPDATSPDDTIQWGDVLSVSANTTVEFSFDNLESGKFLYVGVGSENAGLLVTGSKLNLKADGTRETGGATASDAVNTSQGGTGATIGIDNQMFTPGDSAMFSLVRGMDALAAGQTTGQDVDNIQYDDFIDTSSVELFISQKQGNTKLDLTMTMYSAGGANTDAEDGRDYIGNENINGSVVGKSSAFTDDDPVAVGSVEITDAAGNPVGTWTTDADAAAASGTDKIFFDNTLVNGVKVDINGNVVDVNGIDAFWSVKVNAASGETFNRFELAADTGKFDIGKIVLEEGNQVTKVVGDQLFTDDDGPVASGITRTEKVVEDALSDGNADDSELATANYSAAELALLLTTGADAPAIFSLNSSVSGPVTLADGTAVTSKGVPVTWSYHADDQNDVDDAETISGVAGSRAVFTLVADGSGGYNLTLLDQVDHTGGGDAEILTVDLTPAVSVTDADLDPTSLTQALLLQIENDIPELNTGKVTGAAQEDALPGGNIDDAANDTVTITYSSADIAALFNVGADEPLSLSLASSLSGNVLLSDGTALTSKGSNVTWSIVSATVIAGVVGTSTIFTLTNMGDGTFDFVLLDQVDHGLGADDSDTALIEIDLTKAFAAEDYDGDAADLSAVGNAVTASVENDVPRFSAQIVGGTVDWVAGGTEGTVTNSLNGAVGADQDARYIIDYAEDLAGYIKTGVGTSEVSYYFDLGGGVQGAKAFSLVLNDAANSGAGSYTFTSHVAAPQEEIQFNFTDLPSGQSLFGVIASNKSDLSSTGLLVLGAAALVGPDGTYLNTSDTINTSKGGGPVTIGVDNQMFDPSDGAIFVYLDDPDDRSIAGVPGGLTQTSSDDADTLGFAGTITSMGGEVEVVQTQGGGVQSMKLSAYDLDVGNLDSAAAPGVSGPSREFVEAPLNGADAVSITTIHVYNAAGTLVESISNVDGVSTNLDINGDGLVNAADGTTNGITALFTEIGSTDEYTATVRGFSSGYTIGFETADPHDAVKVEGVSGKWDIGGFNLTQGQDSEDILIDFSVAIKDADDDVYSGSGSSWDDFTIRVDGTGANNQEPEDPAPAAPILMTLGAQHEANSVYDYI